MRATREEISKWADTIVGEIKKDIASGQVAASVASFSELHDHVDANDYAAQYIPEDATEDYDEWTETVNAVEDEVDRRIKAGELSK